MASGTVACAKKKAAAEGRVILFLDESAFYLLPGVRRTWAPIGHPPRAPLPLHLCASLGHERHYPRWFALLDDAKARI